MATSGATDGVVLGADAEAVKASVSKYYGETLQASSDLKTSACCTAKAPPPEVRAVLAALPEEILSRYYGCGSPFPVGIKGSGLRVLDLGCGTGRDCYVCAALVGQEGFVTGIDMTPAQLEVAQRHADAWTRQQLGYAKPNMAFVSGAIEALDAAGLQAGSVDLVISNCVINLSPDKAAVLAQAHHVLADGGELYFSDVYCDRRLPAEVRTHEVLLGECLGGALAVNDFVRLAQQVGFADPRVLDVEPIEVHDTQLRQLLGAARFYSITLRLFKLPAGQLELPPQEDYGQSATYAGSLPGAPDAYRLDAQHTFQKGVPVRVSGNTAAMLGGSWLGRHFSISGDRSVHLGQFAGGAVLDAASIAAMVAAAPAGANGGSCCAPKAPAPAAGAASGGSCCAPAAAPVAAPAAASGGSCCAPAAAPVAAPAAASGGSCCKPKAAPSGGGCCGPNAPAAASGGGSGGGCCAPAPAAPAAAAGGCCAPPAPAAAAGGCCPPAAPAAASKCCGGK